MSNTAKFCRRLLVSGYNQGSDTPGMHLFEFDEQENSCTLIEQVDSIASPSYCTLHKGNLYVVSETSERGGFAFCTLESNGIPQLQNQVLFDGAAGTCFALVHPQGKRIYGADYNSGSVSCCALDEQGAVLEPASIFQHEGHGIERPKDDPDYTRQQSAHVHTLSFVPGTSLLAAVDLGLDMIVLYQLNEHGDIVDAQGDTVINTWPASLQADASSYACAETPDYVLSSSVKASFEEVDGGAKGGQTQVRYTRSLSYEQKEATAVLPVKPAAIVEAPLCSGPRIVAYHPKLPIVAVICELSGEVLIYRISQDGMHWDAIDRWSLVGKAYQNDSVGQPPRAAHLQFSKDARRLYTSVRGTDKIIVFSLDEDCHQIGSFECYCGGMTPRLFALSPDEEYLAVGNKDSCNLVIFKCDTQNGSLDQLLEVPCEMPSCIIWE